MALCGGYSFHAVVLCSAPTAAYNPSSLTAAAYVGTVSALSHHTLAHGLLPARGANLSIKVNATSLEIWGGLT